MVKMKFAVTEIPSKELERVAKMFCSVCREELKDKAIVIRYPEIKVAIPLCQTHYDEMDEEELDVLARLTQMKGGNLY